MGCIRVSMIAPCSSEVTRSIRCPTASASGAAPELMVCSSWLRDSISSPAKVINWSSRPTDTRILVSVSRVIMTLSDGGMSSFGEREAIASSAVGRVSGGRGGDRRSPEAMECKAATGSLMSISLLHETLARSCLILSEASNRVLMTSGVGISLQVRTRPSTFSVARVRF